MKPESVRRVAELDQQHRRLPATDIPSYQRNELIRLRQFTELRESLLEKHQLMLRALPGIGYTVVPPELQTATALKDRTREVRRAITKLAQELGHTKLDALTEAQRQENVDAQAKVGALASLLRRKLPAPNDE